MHNPKFQAHLAYFGGERGAERNPQNYQRRDDGGHIFPNTESYYEWWYFDASFDNGYHVVVTFHYRNIFLDPMIPSVQMFIYLPDGSRMDCYDAIPPEKATSNPDYCNVVMGENRIQDMGDHYELILKIKDMGARLIFENVVPPWKPGEGFNYKDEAAGMTAGWVVPVPQGTVKGELYVKGETIPVTGAGYHDHNWGNYRFHETFLGWYWGRIHHEKYCVDYGWIIPLEKDAPVGSPLLIARPGEILLSTDHLEVERSDIRTDDASGVAYAGRLTLKTDVLDIGFRMDIAIRRIIESTPLPKVTDWNQYYFRFLADYRMQIRVDGREDHISGEMLNEYIELC